MMLEDRLGLPNEKQQRFDNVGFRSSNAAKGGVERVQHRAAPTYA